MALPFDPLAMWRRWADEVDGRGLTCGHLLAEERPDEVVEALEAFLAC
jgi:haloacetate dehalogenase